LIDEKLESLGIFLPIPPSPAGSYIPVVISKDHAYVSGQIPIKEGQVVYKGKVFDDKTMEDAKEAAKLCTINALAQLKTKLGSLDRITRIVKVSGFVNSSPEFTKQPLVINAASDMLYEIFGEKGKHSRVAVGVASLPLDSIVEIDMLVEIS